MSADDNPYAKIDAEFASTSDEALKKLFEYLEGLWKQAQEDVLKAQRLAVDLREKADVVSGVYWRRRP